MFQFGKIAAGFTPLLTSLFVICLLFVAPGPTAAATVEQRLTALESKVVNLQSRVTTLETKAVEQTAVNNTQVNQILSLQATVQKQQTDNVAQSGQIAALANKLVHVSRSGTNLYITGANVHVRSGLGATDGDPNQTGTTRTNGLGNVIVGYNELRTTGDLRTGSHNLVVGPYQNFSSFGGLVAGWWNTVSGPYASVSGGYYNTASNEYASVSGGKLNRATGSASSVSGGEENLASGQYGSVSGGGGNYADARAGSVSGGLFNLASGDGYSSVSGGQRNSASGYAASIGGGFDRTLASGPNDWQAGSLFQGF